VKLGYGIAIVVCVAIGCGPRKVVSPDAPSKPIVAPAGRQSEIASPPITTTAPDHPNKGSSSEQTIPDPPPLGPFAVSAAGSTADDGDQRYRELWVNLLHNMSLEAAKNRWLLAGQLIDGAWNMRLQSNEIAKKINDKWNFWGTQLDVVNNDPKLKLPLKVQYLTWFRESLATCVTMPSHPEEEQRRMEKWMTDHANYNEQAELDQVSSRQKELETPEGQERLRTFLDRQAAEQKIIDEREARKKQFRGDPYLGH
jgi:hypothetical protein